MKIILNGEEKDIKDVMSISALVADVGIESHKVAVERNLEIVPKSEYDSVLLANNDKIEIVHFIGGG